MKRITFWTWVLQFAAAAFAIHQLLAYWSGDRPQLDQWNLYSAAAVPPLILLLWVLRISTELFIAVVAFLFSTFCFYKVYFFGSDLYGAFYIGDSFKAAADLISGLMYLFVGGGALWETGTHSLSWQAEVRAREKQRDAEKSLV